MTVLSLTPIEVTTLVLGIIGTTTGLAALAWNVIAFKLSGHRVALELTNGITIQMGEDGRPRLPGSWNLTVRVSNQGRQALTILDLDCAIDQVADKAVSWTEWVGPNFPHRLDSHAEAIWRCESPRELAAMLRGLSGRDQVSCRVVARLPGGTKKTSNAVTMDEEKALSGLQVSLGVIEPQASAADRAGERNVQTKDSVHNEQHRSPQGSESQE